MVVYSKIIIALCISIGFGFQLQAQNYKFTATVSKQKVAVGSPFDLTYSFEGGRPTEFSAPDLSSFRTLGPPSQGQSTQIVNGNISHTYTFTYRLVADKIGEYIIPEATIKIKQQEFKSNSIKFSVVKANQEQDDVYQQIAEGLFMRTFISKEKVYLGEQVKLTYKLYKKINISNLSQKQSPSYEGFWKEVVSAPDKMQLAPEVINGVRYETGIVESVILFPQKTGKITIDPYILDSRVPVRTRSSRGFDPFFDDFFGGGQQQYPFEIKSPQVVLEVLPLPSKGKPSNFSGLVGDFKFSAQLSKSEIEANESVTLNIAVEGTGNLKLVKPWKLDLPNDIEPYDPKTHDNFSKNSGTFSGKRRYEYLMIPRREGTFKLPPIQFSYFDVNKEQYVSFNESNLTIKVGKGVGQENYQNIAPGTYSKEDISLLNDDIRFISTNSVNLSPTGYQFHGSPTHIVLASMPFGLLFLAFYWRKKQKVSEKDVVGTRKKLATSLANKKLKIAKLYMEQNKSDEFYTEISKALLGFISNKTNVEEVYLSTDKIKNMFNDLMSKDALNEIINTIEVCESVRYAPGLYVTDMHTTYQSALKIITQLEEALK